MLGFRLQFFLIVLCILAFIYLVFKMKTRSIDVKYTMPWLFLDLIMLLMAIFPNVVDRICRWLGIKTASNAVFFAALLFLLAIVYVMSRTISRLNNEIRELSQKIALIEDKDK